MQVVSYRHEVNVSAAEPPAPDGDGVEPAAADTDDRGTARVNLRLPAHLKARAEEAASSEGLSVNAWLVRAVSAAVSTGVTGGTHTRATERTRTGGQGFTSGQSFTGWVH